MKYRISIVGYGNIGRFALEAVEAAHGYVLTGVEGAGLFFGEDPAGTAPIIPVAGSIGELEEVDIALLCVPSRSVPECPEILAAGINTVDNYDIHGSGAPEEEAGPGGPGSTTYVSVISAGWDRGRTR